MSKGLLDPKVDFVFKNIFGSQNNQESKKIRTLELNIEEIREAKNELIRMSNNDEERALYDMRAKALRDKISALNSAKEEGREEGEKNKAIEIAKNMKVNGLEVEMISKLTSLTIDEIDNL